MISLQQMTTHLPQNDGTVLLLDKPSAWTSFDVVKKVRSVLRARKVGHAGTLDPMATGLLIICTERRTREVDTFMGMDKEYEAELTLGARTPSFDADTPIQEQKGVKGVTEDQVREVVASFVGAQEQTPPMWSALKIDGRRLYKLARRGETVPRKPRSIVVHRIELMALELPVVRCTITCSKGTYVRALAEDIGLRLGCGAYLSRLRRTRIGPYHVDDALTIEQLVRLTDTTSTTMS
jgi:tRNA pseudouridine55 synthase